MALATYADLVAAIPTWANRNDLADRLPDFVALAEARMSADLDDHALEKTVSATITASAATLPDEVLNITSLRVVGATHPDVEMTSRERIQSLRERAAGSGQSYAAQIGRGLELYPNTSGTLSILAKCRIPSLQANSTNWVMTNFPHAYLFGSLMEVADFLDNTDGFAKWERRYGIAIGQANTALKYRGPLAASKVHGVR